VLAEIFRWKEEGYSLRKTSDKLDREFGVRLKCMSIRMCSTAITGRARNSELPVTNVLLYQLSYIGGARIIKRLATVRQSVGARPGHD